MDGSTAGSVTGWLLDFKKGDRGAADRLVEHYFQRLVQLARAKLRAVGATRSVVDAEDIAQSVFARLCDGIELGRWPRIDDRENLWRILIRLTVHRTIDERRRQGTLKQGGDVPRVTSVTGADEPSCFQEVICDEPTPELAAELADELRTRMTQLPDDACRRVAELLLEGYSNEEISVMMNCSLSTITLKKRLIRATWKAESPA